LPQDTVNAGGFLPLVRGHPLDRQELGDQRAGQQVLQGLHLVPPLGQNSLCDTHLQPSHLPVNGLPVNGIPLHCFVDGRTSAVGRRLLSHCCFSH